MSVTEQADMLAATLTKPVSDHVRLWQLVRLLGFRKGFKYFTISRQLRERPDKAFTWATECERKAENCQNSREAAALLAWAKKLRNLD